MALKGYFQKRIKKYFMYVQIEFYIKNYILHEECLIASFLYFISE